MCLKVCFLHKNVYSIQYGDIFGLLPQDYMNNKASFKNEERAKSVKELGIWQEARH